MPKADGDRFNVLILMSDEHNKYHLGCHGDPLVQTPHLDRLAAEGMRFSNAYCPSPLCVPSRMAFVTCRYPSADQVWNNRHILPSSIPTWAHAMDAAGYQTALVGAHAFCGTGPAARVRTASDWRISGGLSRGVQAGRASLSWDAGSHHRPAADQRGVCGAGEDDLPGL